ncbi:UNVERIFIED_CONTAM: hypothetical protein NY603_32670, partial [Bacteroidetes bacterium 56_B9]
MKRTVTILGGDERMAWLAESLRREGYIIRLAALLPPAPLKNRLPLPILERNTSCMAQAAAAVHDAPHRGRPFGAPCPG